MADPRGTNPFRTLAPLPPEAPASGLVMPRSEEDNLREEVERGVIFTKLESAVNWAVNNSRANSIWPLSFGLACCAIEMMAVAGPRFDISRFGAEVYRGSPRQADLMIVAGRVSIKMAPVVRQLYDQMTEPKWVVAFGTCASCGGFYDNYATVPGIDKVIPVDVYVPGCPPRPEQIIDGVMKIQELVKNEPLRRRYSPEYQHLLEKYQIA